MALDQTPTPGPNCTPDPRSLGLATGQRRAVRKQGRHTDIKDVFDRLTQFDEARLNRRLRTRQQVTSTTLTVASGTVAVPADFAEVIGVFATDGYEYVARPIQEVQITGPQAFYAISGSNLITNGPEGDRTLTDYATLPSLSSNDSNWLLQSYPALYLYAVSLEAAKYVQDVEKAAAFKAFADMEERELHANDAGERYRRARVRVAGVTP